LLGVDGVVRAQERRADGRHDGAKPYICTTSVIAAFLHFIGNAGWSDEKVLAKVREMVLPEIERHGPIEAWIIRDAKLDNGLGSAGLIASALSR